MSLNTSLQWMFVDPVGAEPLTSAKLKKTQHHIGFCRHRGLQSSESFKTFPLHVQCLDWFTESLVGLIMPTLPPRHPRHYVTQTHRADHGSPLDATAEAAGWQELDPNILHELHRQSTKVYSIFIKLLFLFNEQLLRTQPCICTFKGWAVRPCLACVDSPSQWTEMRFSTPSVGSTRCLFEPQGSLWSSSGLISPYR